MKSLIVSILALVFAVSVNAQCAATPTATQNQSFPVTGNTNFNNVTALSLNGDGTIPASVNFNNVANIIFNGNIKVEQTLTNKIVLWIPAGKMVNLPKFAFDGTNPIYVSGSLSLNYSSLNNSTTIYLKQGATVTINGQSYSVGQTVNGLNGVKITIAQGCLNALPVKFTSISMKIVN